MSWTNRNPFFHAHTRPRRFCLYPHYPRPSTPAVQPISLTGTEILFLDEIDELVSRMPSRPVSSARPRDHGLEIFPPSFEYEDQFENENGDENEDSWPSPVDPIGSIDYSRAPISPPPNIPLPSLPSYMRERDYPPTPHDVPEYSRPVRGAEARRDHYLPLVRDVTEGFSVGDSEERYWRVRRGRVWWQPRPRVEGYVVRYRRTRDFSTEGEEFDEGVVMHGDGQRGPETMEDGDSAVANRGNSSENRVDAESLGRRGTNPIASNANVPTRNRHGNNAHPLAESHIQPVETRRFARARGDIDTESHAPVEMDEAANGIRTSTSADSLNLATQKTRMTERKAPSKALDQRYDQGRSLMICCSV